MTSTATTTPNSRSEPAKQTSENLSNPARVPASVRSDLNRSKNNSNDIVSQDSKYQDDLEKFRALSTDKEKQEFIKSFVMSKLHGRMRSSGLRDSIEREDIIDGIYGTVARGGNFKSDKLDYVIQQAIKLSELADMVDSGASGFPAGVIGLTSEELNKREDENPNLFWLSAESLIYEQRKNGTYKRFWTDDTFNTAVVDPRTGKQVKPGYDPQGDLDMSLGNHIDGSTIDPAIYAGMKTPGMGSRVRYSAHNLQANAKACADLVNSGFPGITNIYGYCHRNIAGTNRLSNHARGKAIDFMIGGYRSANGIQNGDNIAAFLIENADALQVRRIIWRGQVWDANRNKWHSYSHPGGSNDTLNHYDHLHVDFR
jgi:hypothetical protein